MKTATPKNIYYVTRDIERALGIPENADGVTIISNETPFAKSLQEKRTHIVLIKNDTLLDTWQLLEHEQMKKIIPHDGEIVVYKNTNHIQRICEKHGWKLLNPNADLASTIEEKTTQASWLEDLDSLLLPHTLCNLKDVTYKSPIIVQFNRAHSGAGTHLITKKSDLEKLQEQFPKRPVRVSEYIEGPVFTSNNVVHDTGIVLGQLSYQITGITPFTDNKFATIGNDWGVVSHMLSESEIVTCKEIAKQVGEKMRKDGYRGLFGVDIILDVQSKKLYLLEINARQPASVPYESILQRTLSPHTPTTMDLHLNALTDTNILEMVSMQSICGAQIVVRNSDTETQNIRDHADKLKALDLDVLEYPYNKALGSEALRIQSKTSLMQDHQTFNELGNQIHSLVRSDGMRTKRLSENAHRLINDYKKLPFRGKNINCPYYNNRASKIRGALRVHIGKGSIDDIIQEATLAALKEGVDIHDLTGEQIKQFLVDKNIGIDCSAFAFYALDAELYARGGGALKRSLSFPHARSIWRKLLTKLRPVENCAVRTLAHESNTRTVTIENILPADLIIMLDTKKDASRNHVLVVRDVCQDQNGILKKIVYSHSLRWDSDGKYNHGTRDGEIHILDIKKPLHTQKWIESSQSGNDNETFLRAQSAASLEIRRLHVLD